MKNQNGMICLCLFTFFKKGVYEGSLEYDCFVDEHPIGKQVRLANDEKPFWVKLRFKDERYLISRGSGRHSEEHVTKLD